MASGGGPFHASSNRCARVSGQSGTNARGRRVQAADAASSGGEGAAHSGRNVERVTQQVVRAQYQEQRAAPPDMFEQGMRLAHAQGNAWVEHGVDHVRRRDELR